MKKTIKKIRNRTRTRQKQKKNKFVFWSLLVSVIVVAVIIAFLRSSSDYLASSAHAARNNVASSSGTFVTLLFSRSEITASDNCVENDTNIARLDTVVAPYLHSLGMAGTGTLVTDTVGAMTYTCTHNNDTLMASWADAANLSQNYGWSFVSHTATYPSRMSKLTPAQQYMQTCGSAATIDAHGLPGGHGLIAYPGIQPTPVAMQTNYGAQCFAWGRIYNSTGVTTSSAAFVAPYWQNTTAVKGGPCNKSGTSCYTITAAGSKRYLLPSKVIAQIQALQPGQWYTLQAYVLVTGTNPNYINNQTKWDCTSTDSNLHWTSDVERYCYSDWQQIVQAIATMPNIMVTDPLTVGVAFGRPSTYPTPTSSITPTTTPIPTSTPVPTISPTTSPIPTM